MSGDFSLMEWLENAKKDPKQLAAPIVMILCILFIGYKFIYSPKAAKLKKILRSKKQMESSIKSKREQAASLSASDLQLEIEEIEHKFEKAKSKCFKASEQNNFPGLMRKLASQCNIEIRGISMKPPVQIKIGKIDGEKISFNFRFKGDLSTLGIFLRRIEKEEKIIFLNLPALNPDEKGRFDITLEPTTLVLPDVIETKPQETEEDYYEEEEY